MNHSYEEWKRVRCLFETPLMEERKWAKIPTIPADAFIIDLEDSVPPPQKEAGRDKALEYIRTPDFFGGRLTVPRCNHLDTPWGTDDVIAFAEAGADIIMYPKASSVEDVLAVLELARKHGADPKILASIESAQGVMECGSIFQMDEVVACTFGQGDLHVDVGFPMKDPDGTDNDVLLYPKSKVIMAGTAYQVAVIGIAYQSDLKNLEEVRVTVEAEKRLGFTGLAAFYPPHVDVINEVYTPSDEQLRKAEELIAIYEAAVADGKPAVTLANGEAVLVHQYKEAQDLLARTR